MNLSCRRPIESNLLALQDEEERLRSTIRPEARFLAGLSNWSHGRRDEDRVDAASNRYREAPSAARFTEKVNYDVRCMNVTLPNDLHRLPFFMPLYCKFVSRR